MLLQSSNEVSDIAIDHFDLSVRSSNALRDNGVTLLSQLAQLDEISISKIKNIGKKSVSEILCLKEKYVKTVEKNEVVLSDSDIMYINIVASSLYAFFHSLTSIEIDSLIIGGESYDESQ